MSSFPDRIRIDQNSDNILEKIDTLFLYVNTHKVHETEVFLMHYTFYFALPQLSHNLKTIHQ